MTKSTTPRKRNYKPAIFQATVRPDWAGVLPYLPDNEKLKILEAILKFPSVDIPDCQYWQDVIKPDLIGQYQQFVASCKAKQRGICNRWDKINMSCIDDDVDEKKISNTDDIDIYDTSITSVIDVEREREEEGEIGKDNSRKYIKNLSTTHARGNTPKKEKVILPIHQEIADYLADNLSVRLNRKISNRGWADEIRRLCENGNIDPPRIRDALDWHFRKYDRPYRLEIQSARTLREKFSRLETAYLADEPDLPV